MEPLNQEDMAIYEMLVEAMAAMRKAKPEERSEKARRYAVSITELEKVFAYFWTFVVHGDD